MLGVPKKLQERPLDSLFIGQEGLPSRAGTALKSSRTQANVQMSSLFSGLSVFLSSGSL